MAWLAALDKSLVSNLIRLPVCKRFGRVELTGSASTLRYSAHLDVLFSEDWSPSNNKISFRLWPTWLEEVQRSLRRSSRRKRKARKHQVERRIHQKDQASRGLVFDVEEAHTA
mmetsp:Transcript_65526/g.120787  ORF Transcript_65526/g.120787 Transcript_65526/m.120787 type:complete len:113 (+) Transcript_65526:2-340(+)